MKKLLTFGFVFTMCFMATPVFAETIDCGVISDITRPAIKLIMIASPIILIIMGTIDILGVVTAGDEKGMKTAWNKLIKRFVICVVLLLLPIIINLIMGLTRFNNLTACM